MVRMSLSWQKMHIQSRRVYDSPAMEIPAVRSEQTNLLNCDQVHECTASQYKLTGSRVRDLTVRGIIIGNRHIAQLYHCSGGLHKSLYVAAEGNLAWARALLSAFFVLREGKREGRTACRKEVMPIES